MLRRHMHDPGFIQFKAMRLAIAASLHEFCEFNAEAASDHIRLLQNGLSDPLPEVCCNYMCAVCYRSLSLVFIFSTP